MMKTRLLVAILLKATLAYSLLNQKWSPTRQNHARFLLLRKSVRLKGTTSEDADTTKIFKRIGNMYPCLDRRKFGLQFLSVSSVIGSTWMTKASPASAGLVFFPCIDGLKNVYHLMRAGESLLETQDILSTNPLFLTNHEDVLSPKGIEQLQDTCKFMIEQDILPTVVKFSLAAKAVDTANIVSSELKVGRNKLIPEYTFMDPRAIGKWDMLRISAVEDAIWAYDVESAGDEGRGGRPPPSEDSTPNETLYDQSVRLRQLISVLETQYSGDTILLIFPDGTSPALLSAMISGIPFNKVHELNFEPGEIRFNVTMDNVLQTVASTSPTVSTIYKEKIGKGRAYLETLLRTNTEDIINVKEEQFIAEIQRQRDLEAVKQQMTLQQSRNRHSTPTLSADHTKHLPAYGALLAILLAGVGKLLRGNRNENNQPSLEDTSSLSTTPAITIERDYQPTLESSAVNPSFIEQRETRLLENPRDVKVKLAEEAMEEYLSRGDGGDEWLGTVADIMKEN